MLVHAKLAGGARLPIEAPYRYMGLERRLKGRDQLLKCVEGQVGEIQEPPSDGTADRQIVH